MMSDTKAAVRNALLAGATGTADLLAKAETADPALKAALTEKSLIGSKSVWMPLATWFVTQGVAGLGLGWDAATSTMMASLLAYVAVVGCRIVTRSPIGGILTPSKP